MSNINHGTYASLHLTDQSAKKLHAWGKAQGIENLFDPTDFHITVCYSKRPLHIAPLERLPPLPVKVIGPALFGKEKDYLVLKVESKLAHARHATMRALGAAHDFPDYKPHISLAKGGRMPKLKDLEPFSDLLFVNREAISTLDPSFKPGAEQYVDGPAIKNILTAADVGVSLVAYHGSKNDFEQFTLSKAGTATDSGHLGRGIYFSTDPAVLRGSPFFYKVELTLKNPLRVALPDFRTNKQTVVCRALDIPESTSSEAMAQAIKAAGYDGVILDYTPTGYKQQEIMVLNPRSIKSTVKLTASDKPRLKTSSEIQALYRSMADPAGLLYHVAHAHRG